MNGAGKVRSDIIRGFELEIKWVLFRVWERESENNKKRHICFNRSRRRQCVQEIWQTLAKIMRILMKPRSRKLMWWNHLLIHYNSDQNRLLNICTLLNVLRVDSRCGSESHMFNITLSLLYTVKQNNFKIP